jgi:hypothetical protein
MRRLLGQSGMLLVLPLPIALGALAGALLVREVRDLRRLERVA